MSYNSNKYNSVPIFAFVAVLIAVAIYSGILYSKTPAKEDLIKDE